MKCVGGNWKNVSKCKLSDFNIVFETDVSSTFNVFCDCVLNFVTDVCRWDLLITNLQNQVSSSVSSPVKSTLYKLMWVSSFLSARPDNSSQCSGKNIPLTWQTLPRLWVPCLFKLNAAKTGKVSWLWCVIHVIKMLWKPSWPSNYV